jgi:hypothetical protein
MAVEQLMAQTSDVLNLHAPLVTKRISVVAKAPWFDKEYRQLRTVRRKAEKAWRKSKSEAHLHVYKDLCTECSEMAQGKKKAHFSKMIDQAEGNPRTLYQLVNKELDRKQSKKLPDLGIDVADLATKFNTFFVDKIDKIREGMKDVAVPMLVESNHISKSKLMYDFQPTCLEEIKEIIKESGIKSSPADLLPQSLLKENIDLFLPTINCTIG